MKPLTTPGRHDAAPLPAMKKTITTLSLDRALLDAARTEARRRGLTLSTQLEQWVAEALSPASATAITRPHDIHSDEPTSSQP